MEGPITGADNPTVIATVVAARTLPHLKANTVAYACSDPSYAPAIAAFGDTVNVPIPPEFSSNLLADGGTINRQNVQMGSAALVLNKHREISWEITDINAELATPDLQGTNTGQAMANFCEDVDEDLLGIYASFTATAAGAYNTAITEGAIEAAETSLFTERVSTAVPLHCIVSGQGYSEMRLLHRFTDQNRDRDAAGSTAQNLMGKIKGFNVYRAQKLNVTSTTNDHGVCMAPAALLTAVRPLGKQAVDGTLQVELNEDNLTIRMTMSYHHEILGGLSSLDMLYGFVTGRSTHGVELKH